MSIHPSILLYNFDGFGVLIHTNETLQEIHIKNHVKKMIKVWVKRYGLGWGGKGRGRICQSGGEVGPIRSLMLVKVG